MQLFAAISCFLFLFARTILHIRAAPLSNSHQQRHYSAAFVFRRIPPLEQELGTSPTISRITGKENFYFDPLELASDENFARFRECELKHGRVAMLATIGMIAPSLVVRGKGESWTAINVIKSLTLSQYIQILATCAFLEAFVFVQQDPKDMPGDYATGYFGVRDKGRNERSMISELENGRLAMLAFVTQVVSEAITKKGILQQWEGFIHDTAATLAAGAKL